MAASITRPTTHPSDPPTIRTLPQYKDAWARDVAKQNSITLTEARQEIPSWIEDEWWQKAVEAFDNGAEFTRQHWITLGPRRWYRIMRTHRVLADQTVQRRLNASLPDGWAAAL